MPKVQPKLFIMKKIILFIILNAVLNTLRAQTYELGFDAKVIKNYSTLKKDATINVHSMTHKLDFDESGNPLDTYILNTDHGQVFVKDKLEKILDVQYKNAQDYWNAQILFNVLEQLSKRGTQVDLRAEMEDDALEYISRVQRYGLSFEDPFLESYIYSIITKLAPATLIDGRPGNVNLLIERNPIANASMFPNGTLVISTGLISLLHSEDELAAVLAHEIAHFVADHSVQNYNKAQDRLKRAEFWAGLATVLTAAAEGIAAANDSYYRPGAATVAVAAASSQIGTAVCKRLGMVYNRDQESKADEMAVELMKVMKYDTNALSTALSRIEESMKQERSVEMFFASDHPALVDRIKKAGIPNKNKDKNFEKIISFAVSDAATMKMETRRYRQALPLVSQNIENNVATADDYIQKANCILYLRNDDEAHMEVMSLIQEAKKYAPNSINLKKIEILALLRQKKYVEAKTLLSDYKEKLSKMMISDNNKPEIVWKSSYIFAMSELEWANNMSVKLRSF